MLIGLRVTRKIQIRLVLHFCIATAIKLFEAAAAGGSLHGRIFTHLENSTSGHHRNVSVTMARTATMVGRHLHSIINNIDYQAT